jgi:hypothetical protein
VDLAVVLSRAVAVLAYHLVLLVHQLIMLVVVAVVGGIQTPLMAQVAMVEAVQVEMPLTQ